MKNAAGSGAVGLIQFMPSTAKSLGTTTDALSQLTAEAQLDFVQKYFQPKQGRLLSIEDTYMAILYPAAIGQPPDHALFSKGTTVYRPERRSRSEQGRNHHGAGSDGRCPEEIRQGREAGVSGIVQASF